MYNAHWCRFDRPGGLKGHKTTSRCELSKLPYHQQSILFDVPLEPKPLDLSHGFVDLGFLEKYHFTVFQDAAFQFDSFLNCKLLEYLSVLLPFGLPISNLDGCKGDMVASTFGRSQLNFLSAYSVVCVEYVDVFC